MQPLVQLITAWQQYTEQFTDAGVEDFCYNYLLNNKKQHKNARYSNLLLAKQLGKTNSILKAYFKLALRQIPGIELDWYYFLDAIGQQELRKTDVVSFNLLLEPTTGIDILNRMLKAGLISERVDPMDKRARLVKLTGEGNALLTRLNILFDEIASLVLNAVHDDDKVAMGTALSGIVNKHNSIANEGRTKSIEAMENVIQPLLKELNNDTKQTLK
jgi:DNA-binding MarR family transcriptional regulator